MIDTVWYYVDRTGQRQGPVTAAAVADAWRAGQTDDASLVWREGMAEWMPLAGFRAELGLAGEAAPVSSYAPPPAPAPVAFSAPAAPAKSNKGCLIAGVVGGLFLLFVFAILAAIAVPAYQDYVERAKEAAAAVEGMEDASTGEALPELSPGTAGLAESALAEARQHQGLVDDFVANAARCPRDGSEVALPPVASAGVVAITVGEARTGMCTIEVEFGGGGAESLLGERLTLSRDIAGDWYCTSDADQRDWLPAECR